MKRMVINVRSVDDGVLCKWYLLLYIPPKETRKKEARSIRTIRWCWISKASHEFESNREV